ncbi:MAG TPA: GeoRSP system SPASM domain protein [Geobacteraceae bacterium]|nr:GeoRSP system SPASM domain protein [Geobacteraceae bacterium]
MSLPELATPIRLYWDLTPLPETPVDQERICGEIIGLKILSLDLTATGTPLPEVCFPILEQCRIARLAVTLTVSPAALSENIRHRLAATPPKELLIEVTSMEQLPPGTTLPAEVDGISFPVTGSNWPQIPDLFRFASDSDCRRLVLPMQRLYTGEKAFYLSRAELETLTVELALIPRNPDMRITVHDPFLWRGIFPHAPFPEGRCQAANTMLSIDQSGVVYPCPTMPVPLGDLNRTSLRDIATGGAKKELRAKLLSLPAECGGCNDAETCKGGCRGRGEQLADSWEGIDPACR